MKVKQSDEAVVTIRLDPETATAFLDYMKRTDAMKKADAARSLMRQALRNRGLLPEIQPDQKRT